MSQTNASGLVTTPINLMAPRQDGIELVWAVARPARARVEWRERNSDQIHSITSDAFGFTLQSDELFRVRIDHLSPGKEYQVRATTIDVSNEDLVTSDWKSFKTLNPNAASTHFVAWNDTHDHRDTIAQLHAVTPSADFLLWNGDLDNDWNHRSSLISTILSPAGLDVSNQRPLLFTWGNHDSRGPWAYQTQRIIATPSGRPYYAFRSGPVAMIFLNTGEDKTDDHPSFKGRVDSASLRIQQAEWMRQVIAQPGFADAPYRVVCCHLPLRWTDEREAYEFTKHFDYYSYSSRKVWHDILVQWNAQVIISGHVHSHVWLPATKEFPYAQLTGGGPSLDDATWIECKADANALSLVVRSLSNEELIRVEFPPLSKS
jgi:hypothetical protein